MISIYSLVDPRTGRPRYVGKSLDAEERLSFHLTDARSGSRLAVHRWIHKLIKLGLRPQLVILEMCSSVIWPDRERFWIAELKRRGERLLNLTEGGEGVDQTPTIRAKISAARKGWNPSRKTRDRMSRSQTGKSRSVETRARMREAALRQWGNPDSRIRLRRQDLSK